MITVGLFATLSPEGIKEEEIIGPSRGGHGPRDGRDCERRRMHGHSRVGIPQIVFFLSTFWYFFLKNER